MNKFEKVSLAEFTKDGMHSEETYKNIKLPQRATKGSIGYDFFAPHAIALAPGGSLVIDTGIKCQLDDDKGLFIFPRSGLGFKHKVHLANTVGIIDVDYYNNPGNEGHIKIKLCNGSDNVVRIAKGEPFAQGIILQWFSVDATETFDKEREGGFGSTSNNSAKIDNAPIINKTTPNFSSGRGLLNDSENEEVEIITNTRVEYRPVDINIKNLSVEVNDD